MSVPSGFRDDKFATGFGGRLTQMTFAPDGRLFVAEKQGSVRIVHRDGTLVSRPFLTVSTNTESEKGLKGIAFDPAYASNGYVYVYYTDAVSLKNKVSRFTTRAGDPGVADQSSERVLVSGIDSGVFHSGGALAFGADGKLYITTGDASESSYAQGLGNLNGKILRINRDGSIPADNPFVGQSGRRPEIWAYGLRNPFTFAFSATGRLFINDVGEKTWEELNEGARGANYGWPTCEGACNRSGFKDPLYAYRHDDGPGKSITGAVFYTGSKFPAAYQGDYFFGDYVGNYIKRYDIETGQVHGFATNAMYPVDLDIGPDGALYYLSVENRDVHRISYGGGSPTPTPTPTPTPSTGNLLRHAGFESTSDSWPYPWQGIVRDPARAAFVRSTSDPAEGKASLRVDVTGAGEDWHVQVRQPDIPLAAGNRYTLSFEARASAARQVHASLQRSSYPYAEEFERAFDIGTSWRTYTASFTQDDDVSRALFNLNFGDATGQVWIDKVSLTAEVDRGEPPSASISQPSSSLKYRAGDVITFAGSATDDEDGSLPASALTWEVMFHHDAHTHPFVEPFSGAASGSFTVPDTGETSANVWFRIHLRATDSDGNVDEATRDIHPLTSVVTLATQPSGMALTLDGQPVTASHTFTGVVGVKRSLGAPPTQVVGGVTYHFVRWSDNGARTHTIATPSSDQTLTAVYEREGGSSDLIANGGFEKSGSGWLSPWSAYVRSPANASVSRATGNPQTGAGALRIDVRAADLDWSVQVRQPRIALVAGVEHTLTFGARASSSRSIRVAFQRNSSPYPVYFERNVSIGTGWARYTVRFTPSTSDAAALFNFNVGARTGTVWIDDVSLTR